MATLRSGGMFTNRLKPQISSFVSAACAVCSEPDGMVQRVYPCKSAGEIRGKLGCQHMLETPKSRLIWGLFQRPPAMEKYFRRLDDWTTTGWITCPCSRTEDPQCTCSLTARRAVRRAPYAVRIAEPNGPQGELITSGILPGRKQTPFRPELFRFMTALALSLTELLDKASKYSIFQISGSKFLPYLQWISFATATNLNYWALGSSGC